MKSGLTQAPEWRSLVNHANSVREFQLRDFFNSDPSRPANFSRCEVDLLFDFSRQRVTEETIGLLLALAEARNLRGRIDAMFAGERINVTESRPALHVALRNRPDRPILVDGKDVMPEVGANRERIRAFVDGVHSGRVVGATGRSFTDIVNIGIGGSDLGIVMASEALARYRNRNIKLHFVSNIDGSQLSDVLEKVDAARTMFVVVSKTFTTLETLSNAKLARQWIVDRLGAG